ncbi:MAG: hypothetical protein WCT33_04620 [Patescibacteria group bacterium]
MLDTEPITSGYVRCTLCPSVPASLAVGRVYRIGTQDEVVRPESEMVALSPADPELEPISVAKDFLRWPFFDAVS